MICALDISSMDESKGSITSRRTIKAFNDAGHTVYVILPEQEGGGEAQSSDIEELERVRFRRVPSLRSPGQRRRAPSLPGRAQDKLQLAVAFPLLAAWKGRQILKQEKIDLLYGYEVQGVLAASLLRRVKRLPQVARFQGSVLDPTFRDPLNLARKLDHVIALRAPADLYIMTDDGTMGDVTIKRLNPHSRQRLRFWRNGLDLERFRPISKGEVAAAKRSIGVQPDAPLAVTVSRLVRWKRLDRAIRAWPQVVAQRDDALLLIVGDGDERPRLEEMARDLGVAANVRFTGAVRQEEVLNYLGAADIFLSVNDLANAGNPVMEAAACGKAIITLNNGATSRLLQDGVTGILLKPDDDAALTGAIVRLIEDTETRSRLQRQARQLALENFRTWDQRMADEIEAVSELVPQAASGGEAGR
jgi:glycosyltransferase involved in cell wall biosynthesis